LLPLRHDIDLRTGSRDGEDRRRDGNRNKADHRRHLNSLTPGMVSRKSHRLVKLQVLRGRGAAWRRLSSQQA
jgi:hypothetical protein